MVTIPSISIGNGSTKSAVNGIIANAKKTVTNKLQRTPVADSFEKKAYMETDNFWYQPQNFANYARGQYLTEGGKAFQNSHKVGKQVIARSDKLERGFAIETTTANDSVIYYEKDLSNGNIRSVELSSGKPYKSYIGKQQFNVLFHNPITGTPTSRVQHIIGGGGGKIITNFAKDGQTVVSVTRVASGAGKEVVEMGADGITPLRIKKFNTNNELVSVKDCN